MKCSLGISNFLEEMSNLSHSVVFLYFFALIAEEGFLLSSCYSLELCIQMLISFLFSFAFRFSSFLFFFFEFLKFYHSILDSQHRVCFICTAKWFTYTCIQSFFFSFFSRIGYHRTLSRGPCAIQSILVYVNPKHIIYLSLHQHVPFHNHEFLLHLCKLTSVLKSLSSIAFSK